MVIGKDRSAEPWPAHSEPVEAVFGRLDADDSGLTETEAAARLERHGANRLPEPPRRGMVVRFVSQFHNILIYVLLAAAVVTISLRHWWTPG